jgi:cytochrome b subunit of formate dehydrogenase
LVLFHIDNKQKYTNRLTSEINFTILKQIIKKMIFAWSIFNIVNNLVRGIILFELLLIDLKPFEAAIISSLTASSLSYLSINLISRHIKIFFLIKKERYKNMKIINLSLNIK